MKFTRVDNETVNCIISPEDLDECGLELQDFFDHKESAMEFIKNMLERAVEEVDYHPNSSYLPMQIVVLPDKSLSITLSENPENAMTDLVKMVTDQMGIQYSRQISEEDDGLSRKEKMDKLTGYLQGLNHFAGALHKLLEDKKGSENTQTGTAAPQGGANATVQAPANEPSSDEDRLKFSSCVFEFKDMHSVIMFSKQLPEELLISSALYRGGENNGYFLVLKKQDEKAHVFANIFAVAYEFGRYVTTNDYVISSLHENMETVMEKDAVKILRDL